MGGRSVNSGICKVMCVENENEIRKLTEEEVDDILKAAKSINAIMPELRELNILVRNNARSIDREIEERKDGDIEIKDNYIKRFDKVDNGLSVINQKIGKITTGISDKIINTTKDQNKFLRNMLIIFLSCSLVIFISIIWEEAFTYIKSLFP